MESIVERGQAFDRGSFPYPQHGMVSAAVLRIGESGPTKSLAPFYNKDSICTLLTSQELVLVKLTATISQDNLTRPGEGQLVKP